MMLQHLFDDIEGSWVAAARVTAARVVLCGTPRVAMRVAMRCGKGGDRAAEARVGEERVELRG